MELGDRLSVVARLERNIDWLARRISDIVRTARVNATAFFRELPRSLAGGGYSDLNTDESNALSR